jgi:hypothetical protein
VMCNTHASQVSSLEKLMCLKQELATTAELVSAVLKCAVSMKGVVLVFTKGKGK